MLEYHRGYWSLALVLRCRGSIVPKTLVLALPFALLSLCLNLLDDAAEINSDYGEGLAGLFGALSFVVGFLIVFRTQKAYDRWWEAGNCLQSVRSEWLAALSCLLSHVDVVPENTEELHMLRVRLASLFSLMYGIALGQLSAAANGGSFPFFDLSGISRGALEHMRDSHDPCGLVMQWIQRVIVEETDAGAIRVSEPVLSGVYSRLSCGAVKLGGARQIEQCRVPFLFAQMVVVLLLLHSLVSSLVFAYALQQPWMAFGCCLICQFCFWGVNFIALQLERPFGAGARDVPLQELQVSMNKSLKDLLHPMATHPSHFDLRERTEYMDLDRHPAFSFADQLAEIPKMADGAAIPAKGAPAPLANPREAAIAARHAHEALSGPSLGTKMHSPSGHRARSKERSPSFGLMGPQSPGSQSMPGSLVHPGRMPTSPAERLTRTQSPQHQPQQMQQPQPQQQQQQPQKRPPAPRLAEPLGRNNAPRSQAVRNRGDTGAISPEKKAVDRLPPLQVHLVGRPSGGQGQPAEAELPPMSPLSLDPITEYSEGETVHSGGDVSPGAGPISPDRREGGFNSRWRRGAS